ncbi:hypothetical protein B5C34_01150 [Pacificimonas flava]|uniref:Beta-lactamase-related domain-containing protein n=2 Tax=Pacificimonas TaxID=1960290 RepID=A0A219B1W6_9SPHN|nr:MULTISPECIES: serine hydrolase domain-containing protein [Pacificimonas]MBZ6378178.1 beta-lactamase family protein [Pacificimonas aurantium]OWV32194.1 hypothetical protein B5C34_01150 [Pacificimonas flava]
MTKFSKALRLISAAPVAALLLAGCAQTGAPTSTASAPAPTAEPAQAQAPELDQLSALAARYVAEGKVANMVIGVSLPGGETRYVSSGTLALGGDQAADEQSLYRVYSMTKPIIGLATAMLIDEGKLQLDQPLSDIYPAFADVRVLADPDTPGETVALASPITIRHLVTHTSGFGYSIVPSGISQQYSDAGIVPGLRRPNPLMPSGEQPQSLDAFMERLSGLPLRHQPGTDWSYSIGLDVMGAVIQKVSGMPLETFLQQRIFGPLGMDDTAFTVAQDDLDRLTTNYFLMNGSMVPVDTPADSEYATPAPFPAGGAGLVSTTEDYLRFMTAMANGGMIEGRQAVPADAVALATSNILPDSATFTLSSAGGINEAGSAQGYGAGGYVITGSAGALPDGAYGWGGAAGTLASAFPLQGVGLVMMTQYMPSGTYQIAPELQQAVAADLSALMGSDSDN